MRLYVIAPGCNRGRPRALSVANCRPDARVKGESDVIFNVSCELDYLVRFPSALIFSIHAQRNASQKILHEHLTIEPDVPHSEFMPHGSGNRFLRLETGQHERLSLRYTAAVDCEFKVRATGEIETTPVGELDDAAIQFLFPSRYCQSDRLARLAWDLFGSIAKPHDKVVAITEWIHENVEYVRGATDSGTSAYDTVTQRVGVCRDFAHLGIALCRALNIPARYFTGYAFELEPPDMHACFECYIGGNWLVFDATRLAHLNGLVRIATGMDAADTAVASVFGDAKFERMKVSCELAEGQKFVAIPRRHLARRGIAMPTEST
jgi:transglutaminase-like putative cysteine protease